MPESRRSHAFDGLCRTDASKFIDTSMREARRRAHKASTRERTAAFECLPITKVSFNAQLSSKGATFSYEISAISDKRNRDIADF